MTSYAPSHHSWSSTSSLPPWDSFDCSTGTPDSISSASSYFDPFNDHHHQHHSQSSTLHNNKPPQTINRLSYGGGGGGSIQRRPSDSTSNNSCYSSQELEEWKWKCGQLEHTVSRLMRQVEQLRKERDDLMLESVATGTANLVFGQSLTSTSTSTTGVVVVEENPTPCRWDGKNWNPIVSISSIRPQIDPTKSMSKQNPPPCNAYYLLGECEVPRCRFCHTYELTESQVNEMRRGAKFHLCNAIQNGVECPDGSKCIYGHHCPRGPTCSRQHCAFNDEQHRVVPTPRPTLRRRTSFVSVNPHSQILQQQQQAAISPPITTATTRRF
ncbi:hypothetical protein JCM3765_000672 [Sporobolomyces pararoseus]